MKTKTDTTFKKIKQTLLTSGYQVILTSRIRAKHARHPESRFRGVKGYIVPDQLQIFINKSIGLNDRVITLIHELLHEVAPQWKEATVERTAKSTFRKLTVSQLGFLQFFVMTKAEMSQALKRLQAHSPIC